MKMTPCKNCEKRHAHCHASCKEYLDYFEEKRKEGKARQVTRPVNELSFDGVLRNIRRAKKK